MSGSQYQFDVVITGKSDVLLETLQSLQNQTLDWQENLHIIVIMTTAHKFEIPPAVMAILKTCIENA